MSEDEQSRVGARFRFDRVSVDATGARYAVIIGEGEQAWHTEARLGLGVTELDPFDPPAPVWAVDVARALLKTVAKNHAPSADWPRRVHRWRAPRA